MADKKQTPNAVSEDRTMDSYEIPQGTIILLDGKEYSGTVEADRAIVKELKRIIDGSPANA